MNRRLKHVVVGLVVVFAAAQLVRPDRTNPPTDAKLAIAAHTGVSKGLAAVLNRSCGDCHSNATVWPWYSRVAPVSWVMSYGVKKGRDIVNFSEWGGYEPERQRALLAMSCDAATKGKMPGPWTLVHPEARLSPADIEAICSAARQANGVTARAF